MIRTPFVVIGIVQVFYYVVSVNGYNPRKDRTAITLGIFGLMLILTGGLFPTYEKLYFSFLIVEAVLCVGYHRNIKKFKGFGVELELESSSDQTKEGENVSKERRHCSYKGSPVEFNIQEFRNGLNQKIASVPSCDSAYQCQNNECKWKQEHQFGVGTSSGRDFTR